MELTQEQLDTINVMVQALKDKKLSDDYRAKVKEFDQAIDNALKRKQQAIEEATASVNAEHEKNITDIHVQYDAEIQILYDKLPLPS